MSRYSQMLMMPIYPGRNTSDEAWNEAFPDGKRPVGRAGEKEVEPKYDLAKRTKIALMKQCRLRALRKQL